MECHWKEDLITMQTLIFFTLHGRLRVWIVLNTALSMHELHARISMYASAWFYSLNTVLWIHATYRDNTFSNKSPQNQHLHDFFIEFLFCSDKMLSPLFFSLRQGVGARDKNIFCRFLLIYMCTNMRRGGGPVQILGAKKPNTYIRTKNGLK